MAETHFEKSGTKHRLKKVLIFVSVLLALSIGGSAFILYGPINYFPNLLITTAMTTMHHQYIVHWFYSDNEIKSVMSKNTVLVSKEKQNTSLIKIKSGASSIAVSSSGAPSPSSSSTKTNTLINVSRDGFHAWLLEVPDASKVHLSVTNNYGVSGQLLPNMVKNSDGIAEVPLSLVVTGANRHDVAELENVLSSAIVVAPKGLDQSFS